MLTDEAMFERMKEGWRGGLPHTACGNGSLERNTANVRAWLPGACARHAITRVCDAGAGDLVWMRGMQWDVEYLPYDLIPRHPTVRYADITRDALPTCDAILCRMVLNHIQPRVLEALTLFRRSARYLFATQFDGDNLPYRSPQFMRLDLRGVLGEPLESVQDGVEPQCKLALWRIA